MGEDMIKIECLENKENSKVSYTGYIKYKDLVNYALLKPLTVNRLTDSKRLKKMKEYIEKVDSIYPPIVIALEKGCDWFYKNDELILEDDSSEITDNNRLVIIDGQHRFLSIKKLVESFEDDKEISNRRQAVFIVNNMTDIEQRNLFMEINDNMKRVSSVSKRIFSVEIANYISLKTIINIGITKKINIKNDQSTEFYPYKFILNGNQVLFGDIELESFNSSSLLESLDKYSVYSECVWRKVLSFIEENSSIKIGLADKPNIRNYQSIKTEVFINSLFSILSKDIKIYNLPIEKVNKLVMGILEQIKNNGYFTHEEELLKYEKKEKGEKIAQYIEVKVNG